MNNINLSEHPGILEDAKEFCRKNRGANSYIIVIRNDEGAIELHPRAYRPCYGEMRKYKSKSLNRPKDPFPGDLENNFPDGTPVGVVLSLHQAPNIDPLRKHLFSDGNPFLGKNEEFVNNITYLEAENGNLIGVFITTGDIPPTPLVASMMLQRSFYLSNMDLYEALVNAGVKEHLAMHTAMSHTFNYNKVMPYMSSALFSFYNPERYFNKEPRDLDEGMLWSQRCDYNRPEIGYLLCNTSDQNQLSPQSCTISELIQRHRLLERNEDGSLPEMQAKAA